MSVSDGLQPMTEEAAVPHVLDNPVWASLTGPHADLALGTGLARAYPDDVARFVALQDLADPQAWRDLAALVPPGEVVAVSGPRPEPPEGWEVVAGGEGVQLVATDRLHDRAFPEAVPLGPDDAEEMLDLVARTEPGPFLPRTYLLGTYLGVRVDGRLVAMAGERLHPPGFTEISAVCTDPDFRRRGYATRLVLAVAHGIRARGETPLLHAAATNTGAIRLYEALGFELRRRTRFIAVRVPQG
ncbi:putative GNAT family acetyltransferase [Motilibacter rhizosphaerae]|uniref:Putative GNAT family acetyltransferase n=1 Tax=Motilibacter rhizosphaerae TaxID=598652 RepID=A0A4Q7NS35_9ACTN|nr:GNAT family N-acetyltransferase [Motilibacter rhizosphaerae]RZS89916.1 putative GNAT family acetyltransferase [Motilibacter rhizosphaerae]